MAQRPLPLKFAPGLQDPKIGLPLLVVLFLGRTSFYVFKVDFC